MKRVNVVASGLVQGVFFRAALRDEARRLGLTGWVRNVPDGSVEAELQGDGSAVERAVEFCRQGPGSSVVDDLVVTVVDPVEAEPGFRVKS